VTTTELLLENTDDELDFMLDEIELAIDELATDELDFRPTP
jgi:hypothetical protein